MTSDSSQNRLLAIIGHPIGHSLSPLLHTTALRALNLPFRYEAVDIPPSRLKEELHRLVEAGLGGFNVTIPHKQSIIPFLHSVDDRAQALGAVNTVVVDHGRLTGTNTDVDGVVKTLIPFADRIRDTDVLLLGAGGGARSVVYALLTEFHPRTIHIVSWTAGRGETLCHDLQPPGPKHRLRVHSFEPPSIQSLLETVTLIVNATPVGMAPAVEKSPVDPGARFSSRHVVMDLISNPLETTLLRHAAGQGAATVGGLEMLIGQAERAFQLFTGHSLPVDLVRTTLRNHLTRTT
ncbi:MAG: shikimate dehydrogenase [Bacteroidota bacterium]